jgi:hypothetical protein
VLISGKPLEELMRPEDFKMGIVEVIVAGIFGNGEE